MKFKVKPLPPPSPQERGRRASHLNCGQRKGSLSCGEGGGRGLLRIHSSLFTLRSSLFTLHSSLIILSLLTLSCRRYNTQQPAQDTAEVEQRKKEVLLRVNQELVEEDAKTIKAFAERNGWKMQPAGSGLWYMIYRNGQGEKAVEGKTATLAYTVSLLDSTVCYSSERSQPKVFRLGQGGVEAGLEEGVLLMRVGDKARLIMPPHLAYGLTGDGNCIPKRAIIIYDVELLGVK